MSQSLSWISPEILFHLQQPLNHDMAMLKERLGLVSNCWREQLLAGESLESLVKQAEDLGHRYIELRQGCLGEFEDAESRLPDTEGLRRLARRHPNILFNLAAELPILSRPINLANTTRYVETAKALSGHLRIVDLETTSMPIAKNRLNLPDEGVMTSVITLLGYLTGGTLSIEHSIQPWHNIQTMLDAASTAGLNDLRLCYDPCNLWLSGDGDAAEKITEQLDVVRISMVHLKQRHGDSVSTVFEPGEVDWPAQLSILNRRGYEGPFLFEIAPSSDVWGQLSDSVEYFEQLMQDDVRRQ